MNIIAELLLLSGRLCLFVAVVFSIIFIVRWTMRRKKFQFGILFAFFGVIWIPLVVGGVILPYLTMTPEERAAYEESRLAEESRREESRLAEESRKEESIFEESKVDDSYFDTSGEIENEVVDIDTELLRVLMDAGYSIEHATQIEEILNTLGIVSIEIENMTGDAEKGLNAVICYPNGSKERDKRFHFTTEDGVMFYAGFLSEDLYDIEQGGFLKKYTDVHIPEKSVDMETYITLQELAENEVKNHLNYPSTASFGMFDWGVGRSDDNYKIVGKVTAKNGFGVESEISFSVWFLKTDTGFIVEGVALDGVRVK